MGNLCEFYLVVKVTSGEFFLYQTMTSVYIYILINESTKINNQQSLVLRHCLLIHHLQRNAQGYLKHARHNHNSTKYKCCGDTTRSNVM